MKNKFTTIIMGLVTICIISIIIVLGIMIVKEFRIIEDTEIEDFKHTQDISDNSETSKESIGSSQTIEKDPLEEIETTTSPSQTEIDDNYTNETINKYFYNQLNDYSKIIYNAFEKNEEDMKSGTYAVQFGNAFSDVLSKQNGSELLGEYYQSAIEAYTNDNPDVFYLSPSKMYLNVETTTKGNNKTYNVFINSGNEKNYLLEEFSGVEKVNTAIKQLEEKREQILQNTIGNIYEDIKMVHDYLVENITYDTSISKPYIYNIYGALVQNLCVCEGYAKSMKYLLDSMDIESVIVTGKATNSEGKTENHAWNYVKLEDKWYAIDPTWDDPQIVGGGFLPNSYKYKYFLKGSNEMNKDHTPNGQFTDGGKIFEYPNLSMSNYSN